MLPELFAHPTVWSWFGCGYLFVPLVLPFFGIWWLVTHRPSSRDDDGCRVRRGGVVIVFRDPAEVPAGFGPSVVAIGKFDGVHAGHRAVLDRAQVDAATGGARVVAVTFDRNPLALLRPEICPEDLIGVHQKLQLLAETGIDATLMLRFDEELASLTAREFVERVLVGCARRADRAGRRRLPVRARGSGQPRRAAASSGASSASTSTSSTTCGRSERGRRVSSTWIRELLAEGDVETAAKLLGRPASVWGEVVHGLKRGRELGFPTANLSPDLEGFVPADGVYAGWLIDEGSADGLRSGIRYPAAISIGVEPAPSTTCRCARSRRTCSTRPTSICTAIASRCSSSGAIRGMVAFEGIDALIEQIADDVRRVRCRAAPERRTAAVDPRAPRARLRSTTVDALRCSRRVEPPLRPTP